MPDTEATATANQRVTNALLGQKIDQLTEANKSAFGLLGRRLEKLEDRQRLVDVGNATSAEWRRKHEKDHDKERRTTRVETVVGSVMAVAAAVGIELRLPGAGP